LVLGSRRTIPAGVLAYCDGIVGTLVGAGFSYHLAHQALHAFGSLPLGFAQEIFSPASTGGSMKDGAAEAVETLRRGRARSSRASCIRRRLPSRPDALGVKR